MLGQYAKMLEDLKLVKELANSANRDGISSTDVDKLKGLVYEVADIAGPLLSRIPQIFRHYTEHDIGHCCNILDLMGRFIPAETLKQMNALELTLLILTALLHDFGMFVSDEDKEAVLRNEASRQFFASHQERWTAMKEAEKAGAKEKYETLRDALLADYFRRRHPERVLKAIKENLKEKLHFHDIDLTDVIARLCDSHGWGVYESTDPRTPRKAVKYLETEFPVYGIQVNLQYLAVCLRLADIMDFDRSRTPLAVFQNLKFTDPKSWQEWNKHLQVRGWKIDEREVNFATECTHPAFYVAVMEFLDWVDSELSESRRLIAKETPKAIAERYQLHLPPVVERWKVEMKDKRYLAGAFQFQLEYDRIMQLLMDKSLYPDPSLFLRELLQNSLDACRNLEALHKANNTEAFYQPRIAIWDYSDDKDNPRIVFQDNGIGMSLNIVENYFMRVGRSYYRSTEFDVERESLLEKGVELEACSQFGIGILSCFMVADRFEVETYRVGHKPLRLTIEGPTKYFTIEVLDAPESSHVPKRPTSDSDDGPPKFAGTRVTLFLRPDIQFDTYQTLQQFAVNIDYDVVIYIRLGSDLRIIGKLNWEKPTFPMQYVPDGDRLMQDKFFGFDLDQKEIPEITQNLSQVLVPSIVDFSQYEFTKHLRGCAWFWLLADEQGNGCPQRGYLRIINTIEPVGLPVLLSNFRNIMSIGSPLFNSRFNRKSENWRKFLSNLQCAYKDECEVFVSPESEEQLFLYWRNLFIRPTVLNDFLHPIDEREDQAKESVKRLAQEFNSLTRKEKGIAVKFFSDLSTSPISWKESPGSMRELLTESTFWANYDLEFSDAIHLSRQEALALHGILLPASFVSWNPMEGKATKLDWLRNLKGGFFFDLRGDLSITPATSRLFVPEEEARKVIVPITRALLRHAISIAFKSPNRAWFAWFDSLFQDICSTTFWDEVALSEFELLDSKILYEVDFKGEQKLLTRQAIIEQIGKSILLHKDFYTTGRDTGRPVLLTHNTNDFLLTFFSYREIESSVIEINLETPLPAIAHWKHKTEFARFRFEEKKFR